MPTCGDGLRQLICIDRVLAKARHERRHRLRAQALRVCAGLIEQVLPQLLGREPPAERRAQGEERREEHGRAGDEEDDGEEKRIDGVSHRTRS